MKRYNFLQTGGFPVDNAVLDGAIESKGALLEASMRMAGNFAIISGVTVTGATASDGVVLINGELLDFKASVVQTNVIIKEETASAQFEDGTSKVISTYRYATFGSSATQFPFANFKRVSPLNEVDARLSKIEKLMTPLLDGGILLWNKPANLIPVGWAEVTEFRGRMPVGWDQYDGDFDTVGKIGGEKTHILTVEEMPSHSHGVAEYSGSKNTPVQTYNHVNAPINGNSSPYTDPTGGDQPHNNMSPYRIVMFIKYIG